jgi:hypothetical protein
MPGASDLDSDLAGAPPGVGTSIGIPGASDGGLLVLPDFGVDLGCGSAVAERLRRWRRGVGVVCSLLVTIRLRLRRRGGVGVSSLLASLRLILRRGVVVSASTRSRLLRGGADSVGALLGSVVGRSVGAGVGMVVGRSPGGIRFGLGLGVGRLGSRPFPPIGTGTLTGGTVVASVGGVVTPAGGIEPEDGVVVGAIGGAIPTCVTLSL